MVRIPQSTESSSSTQCVLDSLRDRTNLGFMPFMIRPFARSTCPFNAHVFAPEFYLAGREVRAVISDDATGDAITVYNPGYKVYHWSGFSRLNRLGFYPFGELICHDQ